MNLFPLAVRPIRGCFVFRAAITFNAEGTLLGQCHVPMGWRFGGRGVDPVGGNFWYYYLYRFCRALPRWGNKLPRSKTKPSLSRPNRSPLVTSPGNRLSPDSASRWWLHDLHQFIRNIRATRTSFAKWTHENDSGPNGSVSKACFEDRVHLDTAICTPVLEADWKCGAR